jgi:hypothetical protein
MLHKTVLVLLISSMPGAGYAQALLGPAHPSTPLAATAQTVVPALVPYSGTIDGKSLSSDASITFLLFKDESGGEPLWTESQQVSIDPSGHYKVQLGANSPSGLPLEVFANGEARWLEVQIAGQNPQPRTLITTVPYAAKAADAATLGGLPASAFALAGTTSNTAAINAPAVSPDAGSTVTTTGGTSNYLPKFTGASSIANSQIYDAGTGVGIGDVPNAFAKLDVNGEMIMRGNMQVTRTGNATTAKGFPSYGFEFYSNALNSSTGKTDNPFFSLQSEPTGNNTAAPSATFNLLFSNNGAAPAETGLSINPNGIIHFASGQTFPGAGGGSGTITGVTAGTALTGGGTAGNVTLNLDTTKVPLLGVSNNFTGTQTITNGIVNLSPTTGSEVGAVYIGGLPFLHGYGTKNVFVGNAGNFSTSGSFTAATGYQALYSQTSGSSNTAMGDVALYATTTGSSNTAVGNAALFFNSTGSNNTAIGVSSGPSLGSGNALNNTTAVGYGANVGQSNSLALGQNNATQPGTSYVNVGIGTATPRSILEVSQAVAGQVGPVISLTNPAGQSGASAAIDFNTSTPVNGSGYVPNAEIRAVDAGGYTDNLYFFSNKPGAFNNGYQLNMEVGSNGQVGIGTSVPSYEAQLVVVQNEGNVGAIQAYAGTVGSGTYAGYGGNAIKATGGDSTGSGWAGSGGQFYGGNNDENGTAGDGIDAIQGTGGAFSGYAGVFYGDVLVTGTLYGNTSGKTVFSGPPNPTVVGVSTDDPLDPGNKYLQLASVQSGEVTSVSSGNVTTDELGLATVTLPAWFEATNGDFRYQLTVMGQFAQAVIKDKIADGKFRIMTNASHVEVSWQVTGVRNDAIARSHPFVAEVEKSDRERGFYVHPEVFGQPEEKQMSWAIKPEMMKQIKEHREQLNTQAPTRKLSASTPAISSAQSSNISALAPRALLTHKP